MSAKTTFISVLPESRKSSPSTRPIIHRTQTLNICRRCGGFLVDEHCMDVDLAIGETRQGNKFWAMRCVQCGDLIDETILRNRYARRQSDANNQLTYPSERRFLLANVRPFVSSMNWPNISARYRLRPKTPSQMTAKTGRNGLRSLLLRRRKQLLELGRRDSF
jgi:hypothetical protein